MPNFGKYSIEDGVGLVEIDHPPVNALSAEVRAFIHDGVARYRDDPNVDAIVLICAGRTFSVGADIREFGQVIRRPFLHEDVFGGIVTSPKPVIAAIHGLALGGGYELAMACHYRIAVPSAQVGLPEVKLGIPPGSGGTQMLPRLTGVEAALEIICGGEPVKADRAIELGMIDALASEGALRSDAITFARRTVTEGRPLPDIRGREDKVAPARGRPEIFSDFLARNAEKFRGFKAYPAIVDAVRAAAELPYDEGYAVEQRWSGALIASPDFAAQQYYFFAERAAAKGIGLEALLAKDPGSVLGRLSARLTMAAQQLVHQGVTAERIRSALYDFGFPAGMLANDLADTALVTTAEPTALEQLTGNLLYPLVNEGAAMISEGIVRSAEVDVAAIKGLGWPVYRGGPLFWADKQGLDRVLTALREQGIEPSPMLAARAEAGEKLATT
jgi:enoyl-CoA hydratase/carnithine racemase